MVKRTPRPIVGYGALSRTQLTMALRMKSLGLGAVLALSTFALAAQTAPLTRKVKVGDEQKFRIKASIEFGGQEATFSGLQTEKVTEVGTDGTYTVESKTSDVKVVFAGQDVPVPDDQTPMTTSVYNADTTIKEIRGDTAQADAYRAANLATVFMPGKEVKVGDSWTNEKAANTTTGAVAYKASYKIVGEETIGTYNAWKIEFSVKESEGETPAAATGNVWINKADGTLVKNEAKWENAPLPGSPVGAVNGTVTVTRE